MIKNYLTMAWRSLLRNKLHSFINIVGLAIGVSACLVIYLIVDYELSFNKKFEGYDRIYRIYSSFSSTSGAAGAASGGVPAPAGRVVKDEFTGIESVVSFHSLGGAEVMIPLATQKKELGPQAGIIVTDPSFFSVFNSYEWIAGSPEVLQEPFRVVLTESKAKIYFGTSEPDVVIGREIMYKYFQDSLKISVAGIVKDLTFNTDLTMTDFISLRTAEKGWLKGRISAEIWGNISSSSQLFVLMEKGNGNDKLQSQLPLLTKNYKESTSSNETSFGSQPLSDLHYNSSLGIFDGSRPPANLDTLTTLTIIAILLLITGAINFINLETAQAVRRAKEVGVRKTLGSTRSSLVNQFLLQSFLITSVAILLALPLAESALNLFSDFIPAGVHFSIKQIVPFALITIVLIGLLAGLYPAFVLSSFLPAMALKNQVYANAGATRSAYLRRALIVFQFSIAQVLMVAVIVVGWQINFMLNKDIGFRKDAIIYFNSPWQEPADKVDLFKHELSLLSEVSAVSLSNQPPSANGLGSRDIEYQTEGGDVTTVRVFIKDSDSDYLDLYDIPLLAGRNLHHSDTLREYLINETLAVQLGFTNTKDAVGKLMKAGKYNYPIVGVVKDFNIQPLHKKIEPVIMGNRPGLGCFNILLSAQHDTSDLQTGIEKIEQAWKKVYPDTKFQYKFLDDTLKNFYQSEQRTAKLVQTATAMAILISCLGLFGLASLTTTQRIKEIGIRKVLGSSVRNIVLMLSKDFIRLVLIAFAIATPVGWTVVSRWLEGFAFHITLNTWIFIITAFAGILTAGMTVAYHTLKAATGNPVDSLRSE